MSAAICWCERLGRSVWRMRMMTNKVTRKPVLPTCQLLLNVTNTQNPSQSFPAQVPALYVPASAACSRSHAPTTGWSSDTQHFKPQSCCCTGAKHEPPTHTHAVQGSLRACTITSLHPPGVKPKKRDSSSVAVCGVPCEGVLGSTSE